MAGIAATLKGQAPVFGVPHSSKSSMEMFLVPIVNWVHRVAETVTRSN